MKKDLNNLENIMETNVANCVILSGHAGSDPIIRSFGSQKLARVNLAVNEYHTNGQGETSKKTNWFNITFWNAQAELAEQEIKKGSKITVKGRLQTGFYETKDGSKRYTTDIIVNELNIIHSNKIID